MRSLYVASSMTFMADISRLELIETSTLDEVNVLLKQLSERVPTCSLELLKSVIGSESSELWVVKEEGKIVGMGQLVIILKLEGVIAQVEDVVVDETRRGKGLGKMISEKLIERAKARGVHMLQLESNPTRTAANTLYQKLGFIVHETNVYRLKL